MVKKHSNGKNKGSKDKAVKVPRLDLSKVYRDSDSGSQEDDEEEKKEITYQ